MRWSALALAVLALVIGLLLAHGCGDRRDGRAPADSVPPAFSPAPLPGPVGDLLTEQAEGEASSSDRAPEFSGGPGARVALRFVDALDGSPIPGLRYVVLSERRGDWVAASGHSADDGRALVEDLPVDHS